MVICIFLHSMIGLAPCCYNGPPSFTCANLILPFGWWGCNILFCLKMTKEIKLLSFAIKNKSYYISRDFLVVMSNLLLFFTWFLVRHVVDWYLSTQKKFVNYLFIYLLFSSRKWNFKSRFWKTQKNRIIWISEIPLALKPQICQSSWRTIEVNSHWR